MVDGTRLRVSRCTRQAWTVARLKVGRLSDSHHAKNSRRAPPYMARVSGLDTLSKTRARAGAKGFRRAIAVAEFSGAAFPTFSIF
jgi:hypothetical protein